MSIVTITPMELAELRRAGQKVQLIDVRTPIEYREVHVEGARNIPLDELDPVVMFSNREATQGPIYMICHSGSRGKEACEKVHNAGFTNVVNVEGGTMAWVEAGLPVVRNRQVISLERQIRIGAGSLVLLGATLAWFVDPAFVGLSAFVGAGLVFAGVTGFCGMGFLLARMPWNRSPEGRAACAVR